MTSEDRCRLTYAEGNRIREEATWPYTKKGMYLIAAGTVTLLASVIAANLAAGLPVLERDAFGTLCDAILGGDAGAIDRLSTFNKITDIGNLATTLLVAGGAAVWAFGDWKAREALKKANDEKTRILEKEGPE